MHLGESHRFWTLTSQVSIRIGIRIVVGILLLMLVTLQYRLWVGEGSLAEVYNLRHKIETQQATLTRMQQRNQALRAEVDDLKKGLDAIEERARGELGMIREGEIFYQIVEPRRPGRQ